MHEDDKVRVWPVEDTNGWVLQPVISKLVIPGLVIVVLYALAFLAR
jgi:hypothetical protein